VIEIAEKFEPILFFQNFCAGYPVVVAGSTWREDDEKLYEYANTRADFRFIVAPHNITANRLAECRRLYKNSIVYSGVAGASAPKSINTLIIDSIGLLSSLYKYASVCYVGGGFGKDGVHNVLEAAVYGKPVIFGPEYRKYVEAKELVAEGGGISVKNPNQLQMELDKFLSQGSEYLSACKASQNYVYSNRGSTDKIIAYIHANRLLTN
jgi:3-deoxy-D-manno-octulosonic-acid transferase